MSTPYQLRFTPESLQDITDAAEYYEYHSKGLGLKFKSEVKRKLILVKRSPLLYALRYNNVRVALTEIFPYSIHFSVYENIQTVQIHAVLSQFRKPVEFEP
ncbi:type II toxin-antitoxin system RelE/ParE family toxin [Dyadobacter diqingensis]|uniref:type II toxin-antitoxin system RelE/ParE family toxin n=1 Tax=Dyadobacter diqingensis TaxID=2938121 RepID=UPI0035B5B8CB